APTTDIHTLSLHDALPIFCSAPPCRVRCGCLRETISASDQRRCAAGPPAQPARRRLVLWTGLWVSCATAPGPSQKRAPNGALFRSEEHTSELQSRENLVCR